MAPNEKPTPKRTGAPARPRRAAPDGATAGPADGAAPAGERIAKVLSRAGVSSRREAERLIEAGEVRVNGKVITSPALNVTPGDKVTVSGQPVGAPEPARLWLYYKPEGLVTTTSDEKGRDTVFDHLPEDMPRVMSVGRLDLNSEGLLLLTNDGELKRRLELPSTGWLRKYRVRVKGNPTDPELEPLRKGVTIDGERFQPMEVKLDRHQGANAWLTIGLREGRNREIRRAIDSIGFIVNRLIRLSYGPFRLNEMRPGDVEEVKPRVLRDQLGMTDPDEDAGSGKARAGGRGAAPRGAAKPAPRTGAAAPSKATPGARTGDRTAKPAPKGRSATSPALQELSRSWKAATTSPAASGEKARGPRGTAAGKPEGARAEAGPKPARPRRPASTRNSAPDERSGTGQKPGAKPGPRADSRPDGKPPAGPRRRG